MAGAAFQRDPFIDNVGRRIAELRLQRDITQDVLAAAIHTGLRGLQRIEAGEREPKITTLKRIADALEVPIALLFEPAGDRQRSRGRPRKQRP